MTLVEMHHRKPIAFGFHYKLFAARFDHPDDAATSFGLKPIGDAWRQVDRATAKMILNILLKEDMAYSWERLPDPITRKEADQFVSNFSEAAKFFTNGTWEAIPRESEDWRVGYGPQWHPATDATFDGGVLALDAESSGLLWLEDED